jgi:hypothetical protein
VLSSVTPLAGEVVTSASSWAFFSAAVVVGRTRRARGAGGGPPPEEKLTTAKVARPTTISAVPSKISLNVVLACLNRPRRDTLAFSLTSPKPRDNWDNSVMARLSCD